MRSDTSSDNAIITEKNKNGVLTIKINRPDKKNALNVPHYREITNQLEIAKNDDEVKVIFFTSTMNNSVDSTNSKGTNIFCAGFDFTAIDLYPTDDIVATTENFFDYLIDYPKVIVAGVNGRAIGIGFTMLFFMDVVFCSESSTFISPFSKVGLFPEGCSSYFFNLHMGRSLASHMLLYAGEISSQQAKNFGIVLDVFKHDITYTSAEKYAIDLAKIPLKKLNIIKQMMTRHERGKLKKINEYEASIARRFCDPNSGEMKEMREKFAKKKAQLKPKF